MGEFLTQVSQAHPTDLIVMVLDGASSHTAKDLVILVASDLQSAEFGQGNSWGNCHPGNVPHGLAVVCTTSSGTLGTGALRS
ncbi:MAG: hypothetical protein ACYCRE_06940 [Acidobacteriaceae bacterium]